MVFTTTRCRSFFSYSTMYSIYLLSTTLRSSKRGPVLYSLCYRYISNQRKKKTKMDGKDVEINTGGGISMNEQQQQPPTAYATPGAGISMNGQPATAYPTPAAGMSMNGQQQPPTAYATPVSTGVGASVPPMAAPSFPMNEQEKVGSKCCFCCCDFR